MSPATPLKFARLSGLGLLLLASGWAAEASSRSFDLPADVAALSLKSFARQAGVEVLISAELGREVRTQPVKGRFTASEALDRMLARTGLMARQDARTGSMTILPAGAKANLSAPPHQNTKNDPFKTHESKK